MQRTVLFSQHIFKAPRFRAFSLLELLAVLATTGFLAALCVGATQKALNSASRVREVNAARQLVAALQSSAADNNGIYLPGMDYRAGTKENPVYKADGQALTGHAAQRYPFRLAPYLGNEFEGTILVSRNKAKILQQTAGSNATMYDYILSTYPALGMNAYCVGGVVRGDNSILNEADCISRSSQMRGSILAFASAGSGTGKNKNYGFSYVSPPTKENDSPICFKWSAADSWTKDRDPMEYGWVDFRHDGKAVCAFLDGSTRLCTVKELSDMRLWTPTAQDTDNPAYVLAESAGTH